MFIWACGMLRWLDWKLLRMLDKRLLTIFLLGCTHSSLYVEEQPTNSNQVPRTEVSASPQLSYIDISEGEVSGFPTFTIDSPKVRTTIPHTEGTHATLVYTVEGNSSIQEPLQSGEMRHQIGLKLLAQNSCNVVYVMRHEASINISVKLNPLDTLSQECQDRGYFNIPSTPSALIGNYQHTLEAYIDMHTLIITVIDDGRVITAQLPPNTAVLRGNIGFRSDNVKASLSIKE